MVDEGCGCRLHMVPVGGEVPVEADTHIQIVLAG